MNNCPATSITAANTIASIAAANWWISLILRSGYQNSTDQNVNQRY
jgi:hypothetical protein